MPLKAPKPEKIVLPFKSRRQELAEEERKRNELFINRSLDAAEGFSWSASNQRPMTLSERYRAFPLHKKLFAMLAVLVAGVIITAFVQASRSGVEPEEMTVYFESWKADRSAADAQRERDAVVAQLRAEEAARQKAIADYQAKLAAERAANGQVLPKDAQAAQSQ